jgi:pimeloyl-ACP methyl ester carboxylesterase
MKKLLAFMLVFGIFSMACQTLMPTPAGEAPVVEDPASVTITDIAPRLGELGGVACAENPELTCVTLQVPLDHFDAANTETIAVTFAVLPASGERYGMFLQAFPGGPGGEGISSAYTGYFSDGILEHYDIIYYDQRGIGLSNPLECPAAYAADFLGYLTEVDNIGEEGYDTPEEQKMLVDDTRKYINDCVAEIGIDPSKLAFFGTDQVAEDIESFRATIGDEKFWMYGVSYGTAVAQTYAYAHPERLAGLILDGTINMTLSGEDSTHAQEVAFEKVLLAVLNACNEDKACSSDMGGKDAVAVYDDLAAKLADKPVDYQFPLKNGERVNGKFTFNQFEYTASYQMYSLSARMMFLKALAATQQGDFIPMMRLMYQNATVDPATFEYIGDPTFSDTMFLGVFCTDDTYFSGTQEERIAQSIEAGQASNGTLPRLDGSLYVGVSCALWPAAPQEAVTREPLTLEGVPTFVLNATLDPATPFEEGQFVAQHLADGYHIYVEGGVHSIYGWGNECPDNYISDFMVDGSLPSQREIVCQDWETQPYSLYVSNLPQQAGDFPSLIDMMIALEDNFYYLPEVYNGDWEEEDTIGCTYGGTYSFGLSSEGAEYKYDRCSMISGIQLTGNAAYNGRLSLFNSTLEISGEKEGALTYVYNYETQTASLTGDYGGETVSLTK